VTSQTSDRSVLAVSGAAALVPRPHVRAALELVTTVEALGADVGSPDLHLRAGVLTGEAAVTLDAEGRADDETDEQHQHHVHADRLPDGTDTTFIRAR